MIRAALTVAAALLAACASTPKEAEEPPKPRVNPFKACRSNTPNEVPVLDETRETVQETVCGATLWFDGLFGERHLASARRARGRIEVSTANSEFEGEETRVRFDARVQLPALEERLSLFIGRDNEDDVSRDRSEGLGLRSQSDQLQQVEDFFAGIGFKLREDYNLKSEFRVGVRGVRHPVMYMQVRNTWTAYEDDNDQIALRVTPFVNHLDGAGVTVGTDYDRALAPKLLFRWSDIATVTEETSGMPWRSALLLYRSLRNYSAIALETFWRGATAAPEPLLEYGVRTIYRQPILKRRLFAELVVGYSWPRIDPALEREGSAGATFGLEMPFGVEPE